MQIFVTGGSGFVGGALIPHLIEAGHTVKALARSQISLEKVKQLGAIGVRGDLENVESLQDAIRGCDAVVHLAAAFEMWGDPAMFHRLNVDATDQLLQAARAGNVRRFIYMSAASVIAGGYPADNVDESYVPPHPPDDFYSYTKGIAENHVIAANSADMMTIALRPPLIWGHGHPMTQTIRDAVQTGRWMWIGGGQHRLSTVHIENLCAAVLASLISGQGGEIYHVTDGEAPSLRPFLTRWLQMEGIQPTGRSIPRGVALTFARIVAGVWSFLRLASEPPLTPGMVYMLGTELTLNDRRARRELDYRNVISIEAGLRGEEPQPQSEIAHFLSSNG